METDIPVLLEKFFKGECTLEEKLILEEWYHSLGDEDHVKEVFSANQLKQLESLLLVRINSAIDKFENAPAAQKVAKHIGIGRRLIYAACGIAAVLALVFYFYPSAWNKLKVDNTGQEQVAGVADYLNNGATIKKIVLVDGSTVWLSPKGKLKVLNHFDKDTRELFLDGLAFFEVANDVAFTSGNA